MDAWGMVQLSSNLLNFFAHLGDWILSVQISFSSGDQLHQTVLMILLLTSTDFSASVAED